jgi:hypothetical protein
MREFKHITGQLFFRFSREQTPIEGDPRELFMVVGVLAVPKDLMIQDAHQYTITGSVPTLNQLHQLVDPEFNDGTPKDIYNLELHRVTGTDFSEKTRGMGLGHLVTSPMWRV